jgi:hypothetical protein
MNRAALAGFLMVHGEQERTDIVLLIGVQFGTGGVTVVRQFEDAPQVGDILHISYGNEQYDLLVNIAQHSEDPEDNSMRYFAHAEVIEDLSAELKRQLVRGRG